MKALGEIGIRKAWKYISSAFLMFVYRLLFFHPIKNILLSMMGAKLGTNVILENVKFFNLYRRGMPGLILGDNCFIGYDTLLDLAGEIEFASDVTLGERIMVLTHMNVGYADHPLQKHFPSITAPVHFGKGCFIGSGSIILAGVKIGEKSLVAAGSVVIHDVPAYAVVGGNPAKEIKKIPHLG